MKLFLILLIVTLILISMKDKFIKALTTLVINAWRH